MSSPQSLPRSLDRRSPSANTFSARHCNYLSTPDGRPISKTGAPASTFRPDLHHQKQVHRLRVFKAQRRQVIRLLDENENNALSVVAPRHNRVGCSEAKPNKHVAVAMPLLNKITLSPSATVDAARWSLCALITEASRYQREATGKSGERRFFHLPESMNMSPVAFGSAEMTELLLKDVHKIFEDHGCHCGDSKITDSRCGGGVSPLPNGFGSQDARPIIDALLVMPTTKHISAATQACRSQLAMLDHWSLPKTPSSAAE